MPKNSSRKRKASGHKTSAPAKAAVKLKAPRNAPPRPEYHHVVGIGASAGGLEALTEMLRSLPSDTGMAFVFVQHLDPKHESMLSELLARETSMRVREVTHGMRVEPNQLYVIPRNASMTISQDVLSLTPRQLTGSHHLSVDYFFHSLAQDQGPKAIGVILSGTASDGALGLKAIKAGGGITFAQDDRTAKYDGMPRSAVAAGGVDFILTPSDIAKEIVRISRQPYILATQPAGDLDLPPESADGFNRILNALRLATGVDFAHYKSTTVKRRILRRMHLHRLNSIDQYAADLQSNPEEVRNLYEDILINVTQFFRDPDVFAMLCETVFPGFLQDRNDAPIRLWVPGCSTGEEVYSLAICLIEFLETRAHQTSLQIFGTDISDHALGKARAGIYSASIAQDVSSDRLRRFFVKVEGGYQIAKHIREMCVFARQNLAKDPPFSKLDLISCRNVLIYLGPVLQKKIIPIFHYALKPTGSLLLGSSETIGLFSELFTLTDKKYKLYARRPVKTRVPLDFSVGDLRIDRPDQPEEQETWKESQLQREADRAVLARYGPPGVVIDEDLNILTVRGHIAPYLQQAPGAATLNVLRMAVEGVLAELRYAIQHCRKENAPFRREGLRVRTESGLRAFNLEVVPLNPGASPKHRRFLILFEENRLMAGPQKPAPSKGRGKASVQRVRDREVGQLQADLATTKDYLQAIIEEQEATNEELLSANEEIQSSNEELQSTNEELETTKEELQSANEELNTINEELQNRNLQLTQVTNDLINLLSNVNLPILMLGNDLRIRRFTPMAEKVLNLIASDIGRPITDINLPVEIPNLGRLILTVIESLSVRTLEVRDRAKRPYSLRIRPYRTAENKIEGVVMVLVDLDPLFVGDAGYVQSDHAARLLLGETTALIERRDLMQALASKLLSTHEEENRRIARELHDDLNQRLALLEMRAKGLSPNTPAAGLAEEIREIRAGFRQLSDDLSRIARQLHPAIVEDLGLAAALKSYVKDFAKQYSIDVRFTSTGLVWLPREAAVSMFRIAQEALGNLARHSGARKAALSLVADPNAIRLTIRDYGHGFGDDSTITSRGLGITSMEERARLVGGVLHIKSDKGGTQVEVYVPAPNEGESQSERQPERKPS